jgi:hypothetical protein
MYPLKATHSSKSFKTLQGALTMDTRPIRGRKVIRLESLEVRSAPSHFGVMGHAAVALHKVHAAAQVRHFNDSRSTDKNEAREKNSGADRSQDHSGTETNSNDPNSNDPGSNDPNSIDSQGNR